MTILCSSAFAAFKTDNLYVTGNAGIGTTSPLAKLNIVGGTETAAVLQIGSGGIETTVEPKIMVSELLTDSIASNPHSFVDVSRMNRTMINQAMASFDASVTFDGAHDYDHYAAHKARFYYQGSGSVNKYYGFYSDLNTTGSTGTIDTVYRFYGSDDMGSGIITNNYGLYLTSLTKGANNWAVYTAGTTKSYFGGSVGLGTTSPEQALDLSQDQPIIVFHSPTTGYTSSDGGWLGYVSGESNMRLWNREAGAIQFAASNAEKMRITSAGNVGIGTTSPNYKLKVIATTQGGSIIVEDNDSANSIKNGRFGLESYDVTQSPFYVFLGRVDGTNNIGYFGGGTSIGSAATQLKFYTASALNTATGTERMSISSDGNVGIGSTVPTSKLQVNGFVRTVTSDYRRYYHVDLFSANPGASGATFTVADANTIGGWQLNAATEVLYIQSDIHSDWDGASNPNIEAHFEVNTDNTGGGAGDTVDLKCVLRYKGLTEVVTKTQTVEVPTTVGASARYKQFEVDLPIDWDAASNVLEVGDTIQGVCNLETDTSEVDDIILNAISISYPTTHTGIESGDE